MLSYDLELFVGKYIFVGKIYMYIIKENKNGKGITDLHKILPLGITSNEVFDTCIFP